MVKLLLWVILALVSFPLFLIVGSIWLTVVVLMLMLRLVAVIFGSALFGGALAAVTSTEFVRRWRRPSHGQPRRTVPGSTAEDVARMRRGLGLPDR